ncbi:MAG: histidine--tRNA ligase [Nitrospinota bacterium]
MRLEKKFFNDFGKVMKKNKAVKGVKDVLPQESQLWGLFEGRAKDYFGRYGFDEIRIPIFERTDVFSRGLGGTTDIVEKEMYTFKDRGGESLTLRPEGTASVVRAFVEHKLFYPPGVIKLFYMGPMFRCERPQAGRYRQFYQVGAELFGTQSAHADAETIGMLMEFLGNFRLKNLTLHLNTLGCPICRPGFRDELVAFVRGRIDSFCANCVSRYERNPLRIFDCKSAGCKVATEDAPLVTGFLCSNCEIHFSEVKKHLKIQDVSFTLSPRLVRGLDYYTRTAFEITAQGLGSQNAIAGGGRYDQLVEELGGPATPAFGFALGVERVLALIDGAEFSEGATGLFVVSLGEPAKELALKIGFELRRLGFRVEQDYENGGLKSQMKKANRCGARFCLILGENEIEAKSIVFRDMKTGTQENIALGRVTGEVAGRLNALRNSSTLEKPG